MKQSGTPFILVLNGCYTENYNGPLAHVLSSGIILGSSGNGEISAAALADFAEAAVAVLTSEGHVGKIYEPAGDETFTMSDLAAEIVANRGKVLSIRIYRWMSILHHL